MYDPNDVPDNTSGVRDDAPMEMKPLPTNVPQGLFLGAFKGAFLGAFLGAFF